MYFQPKNDTTYDIHESLFAEIINLQRRCVIPIYNIDYTQRSNNHNYIIIMSIFFNYSNKYEKPIMYIMRERILLTELERKSSWHTALTTEGKVLGATLTTTSSLAEEGLEYLIRVDVARVPMTSSFQIINIMTLIITISFLSI